MNNREWLYGLDVADLADWFEAEHVEDAISENLGKSRDSEIDSREKLEADVRERSYHVYDSPDMRMGCGHWQIDVPRSTVFDWLDRQAAITERKHIELTGAFQLESDERIAELQAKVDELTAQLRESNAERERLRGCLGIVADALDEGLA